jgi:hypothetical protein
MVIGGRYEDQGGFMRCCYRNEDENVVEDRIVVHQVTNQQQPCMFRLNMFTFIVII